MTQDCKMIIGNAMAENLKKLIKEITEQSDKDARKSIKYIIDMYFEVAEETAKEFEITRKAI